MWPAPPKTSTPADTLGKAEEYVKGLVGAAHAYHFNNSTDFIVKVLLEENAQDASGVSNQFKQQELTLKPREHKSHDAQPQRISYTAAFFQNGQYKVFKKRQPVDAGTTITIQRHHWDDPEFKFVTAHSLPQALELVSAGAYQPPSMHGPQAANIHSAGNQMPSPSQSPPQLSHAHPVGHPQNQSPALGQPQNQCAAGRPQNQSPINAAANTPGQLPPGFISINGSVQSYSESKKRWSDAQLAGLAIAPNDHHEIGTVIVSYLDGSGHKVVRPQDFATTLRPGPSKQEGTAPSIKGPKVQFDLPSLPGNSGLTGASGAAPLSPVSHAVPSVQTGQLPPAPMAPVPVPVATVPVPVTTATAPPTLVTSGPSPPSFAAPAPAGELVSSRVRQFEGPAAPCGYAGVGTVTGASMMAGPVAGPPVVRRPPA